ncbi:MAG: hypothetical protein Q8S00_08505 [Deltaproteobacteria bacterium]|nr:hypothetical protein [Deltaproteobacteria bacterium]MDZ4343674.1 hypothetical protein [Candidatus Binatia bacterium]
MARMCLGVRRFDNLEPRSPIHMSGTIVTGGTAVPRLTFIIGE